MRYRDQRKDVVGLDAPIVLHVLIDTKYRPLQVQHLQWWLGQPSTQQLLMQLL